MNIIECLKNPDIEFSPMPFWFFNDEFSEKKVRTQLKDYVDKGVNGFVLHPRIGVPESMQYLSKEFFDAIKFIVKTADELKMKVILYDEAQYPSGSAHGEVVRINPQFAAKGIHLVEKEGVASLDESEEIIVTLDDGAVIAYGFTGGNIRGIHFGEDDGESGAPAAADILNKDAVALFIKLTHDAYYENLSEYFGNTVIGFFTDEPSTVGRNAASYRSWNNSMKAKLLAAGVNLKDLEGLFRGTKSAGRADIIKAVKNFATETYEKIEKEELRENFYGQLSAWCENHGISFMGHPAESDDIEEELYFHIPGQDLIMRRVAPETGGLREFDSLQAKLSADIARHLGRRRNANECFGVCNRNNIPWYFTAQDMIWYINWLTIRGVNLLIPHAFYYSLAGARKEERPPDVGQGNIWWPHYKMISDYIKRLCYLQTDSVNMAKVGVICDNNDVPYDEIAYLYENQIEFNYLPVSLLKDASVDADGVHIAGYTYDKLLNIRNKKLPENCQPFVRESIEGTSKYGKAIRCTNLVKNDTKIRLISNEGNEKLTLNNIVEGFSSPRLMDLWSAEVLSLDVNDKVDIYPCQTLAVIDDACQVPKYSNKEYVDITDKLTLVEETEYTKEYEFESDTDADVLIAGEEMCELVIDDTVKAVTLVKPHRFTIGKGKVRFRFTGNISNHYGNDIKFGID